MESETSLKPFNRVILILGLVTLFVYAGAIVAAMLFFKGEIRQQILYRDGSLLTNVTQHFHDRQATMATGIDHLEIAMESSEISGVIGVRLYEPSGELIWSIPASLYEASLSDVDLMELDNGRPVIRHFPTLHMDLLFDDESALNRRRGFPMNEVLVPVRDIDGTTVAMIQYWLDGAEVAAELKQLDKFLLLLGSAFFMAGGLIFIIVFLYARKRLMRMGNLLADRNASLERANADLAMAARTSAIGSVTSHLFHGLKNPLAGLKAYLRVTGQDDEAIAIADRMQSMIDEALSVISESNDTDFQLTLEEVRQMAEGRLNNSNPPMVEFESSGDGTIPARKAQLILLVLRNLVENAREASPDGSNVHVKLNLNGSGFHASVEDHGPGLPEHIRERLFEPVQSTKNNGSGIGLAISSVIARHIPATVGLVKSDPHGTTFKVEMPL
jgi:signal transduction histidine kinase